GGWAGRVAKFARMDMADIMPDARLAGGGAGAADDGYERAPQAAAKPASSSSTGSLPLFGGKNPPRPGAAPQAQAPDNDNLTPKMLADARAAAARDSKFDRSKYVTLRTLPELQSWIGRAKDLGRGASVSTTARLDPMQAEPTGFAVAVGPNNACYVPLAHKKEGDGSGLFSGGLAPDQISASDALAALKALFADNGVLKISDDMKFNT